MTYPGGKNGAGVAQRIINLMPPHDVYIEPFLGNAAVMRAKRPARVNIGLDLDPSAPGLAWLATLAGSDVARSLLAESGAAAGSIVNGGADRRRPSLDSALKVSGGSTRHGRRYSRLGGSGVGVLEFEDELPSRDPAMCPDPSSPTAGQHGATSTSIETSESAASPDPAIPDAIVWRGEAGDGVEFLRSYPFTGRELVYCDPPYLMSTRSGRRFYAWEWWVDQHRQVLRLVMTLPCPVMISGYKSSLYAEMLGGWSSVSYEAMTRGGLRTEWLWFNFPPPVELHDYRFLGEGFRERERIKRKKARWTERLRKMPALERQALLAAIADIGGSGESGSAGVIRA